MHEVRLMIEAVLQYSLYRLFDPVDLEGALVSLFHQILEEGELLRSNWLLGSPVSELPKARFCLTTCCHLKFTRALRLTLCGLKIVAFCLSNLHMHLVVLLGIFHCMLTYSRWKIFTICTPLVNASSGE